VAPFPKAHQALAVLYPGDIFYLKSKPSALCCRGRWLWKTWCVIM